MKKFFHHFEKNSLVNFKGGVSIKPVFVEFEQYTP